MCILLSMNYFRGEFIREYHYLYREIVKQMKRAWKLFAHNLSRLGGRSMIMGEFHRIPLKIKIIMR